MSYKNAARIFSIFFALILSGEIKSQDYYSGDVRFGLSVAPNLSWFSANTDAFESDGSRAGWAWGLNVDYFFTSNYALSTGLHMQNYGGKLSYPDLYRNSNGQDLRVNANSNVRFNAVQLPLALKMRTSMLSAINVYGKFGVLTAINYNRSEDYEAASANPSFEITQDDRDFEDDSGLFNLALMVGAGVEYNIAGTTAAFAGITFHQGILNQLDKRAYLTDQNENILPAENTSNGPQGDKQKASINFISLDLGVFF